MDDDLTGRTGQFVAGLTLFRDASVPEPGAALRTMFASQSRPVAVRAAGTAEPRRPPVYKRILVGLPSKIAAGALGALLAGSVGAGALTGTMVLTSNDDDVPAEVQSPPVDAEQDAADAAELSDDVDEPEDADEMAVDEGDEADEVDEVAVDEVDDAGANDAADDVDLAAVPVPTTPSEAAHTHGFDEACGNHGAYVSHFARTGEEPPCAVEARAGADGTRQPEAVAVVHDDDGDEGTTHRADKAEQKEAKRAAHAERKAGHKSGKDGR